MNIIESLEREGGHIALLMLITCYALLVLSITANATVAAVCHDIVVGGFSALLAMLKGTSQQKPPGNMASTISAQNAIETIPTSSEPPK